MSRTLVYLTVIACALYERITTGEPVSLPLTFAATVCLVALVVHVTNRVKIVSM